MPIALLFSKVEMQYGFKLLYKHDFHKTAINLIDAQLEIQDINLQTNFAREQDRV